MPARGRQEVLEGVSKKGANAHKQLLFQSLSRHPRYGQGQPGAMLTKEQLTLCKNLKYPPGILKLFTKLQPFQNHLSATYLSNYLGYG